MIASLKYVFGNQSLELERDKLEDLDRLTTKYENSEELEKNVKYREKIGLFLYENDIDNIKDGDIKIVYSPCDLSISEIENYTLRNINLMEDAFLSPIYKEDSKKKDSMHLLQIINQKIKKEEVAEKIYYIFENSFTDLELLEKDLGVKNHNSKFYEKGFQKFLKRMSSGEEGYFFLRLIDDEMGDVKKNISPLDSSYEAEHQFSLEDYSRDFKQLTYKK